MKLEFTPKLVDLANHEQKNDWYLKINPVGKVPCLVIKEQTDSLTLIESRAIMKYLVNSFDIRKTWTPESISEATTLNSFLFWDMSQFYRDSAYGICGPVIESKTAPPQTSVQKFRETLKNLDRELAENGGFLCFSGRLSAADISVAIGLDFAESVKNVVNLSEFNAVDKMRLEKLKC